MNRTCLVGSGCRGNASGKLGMAEVVGLVGLDRLGGSMAEWSCLTGSVVFCPSDESGMAGECGAEGR